MSSSQNLCLGLLVFQMLLSIGMLGVSHSCMQLVVSHGFEGTCMNVLMLLPYPWLFLFSMISLLIFQPLWQPRTLPSDISSQQTVTFQLNFSHPAPHRLMSSSTLREKHINMDLTRVVILFQGQSTPPPSFCLLQVNLLPLMQLF